LNGTKLKTIIQKEALRATVNNKKLKDGRINKRINYT